MPEHHHDHDHAHHHVHFGTPEMTEHAELEGTVLLDVVHQAAAVLTGLAAGRGLAIRRVVDLGSGPGVGSCALAEGLPGADVVAVDGAAGMLERAATRAAEQGVADRVQIRRAELPAELSELGGADLVWASMSMHHLGDEVAAFRAIRELVGGGLLAVVERGRPWRVLPDDVDLGRPGLWERADAASATWFNWMRAALPDAQPSDDYADMIRAAGFELLVDQQLPIDLPAPLDAAQRRVARRQVAQALSHLGDDIDADDRAALELLLDDAAPDGIMQRPDAILRGARRLFVAAVG